MEVWLQVRDPREGGAADVGGASLGSISSEIFLPHEFLPSMFLALRERGSQLRCPRDQSVDGVSKDVRYAAVQRRIACGALVGAQAGWMSKAAGALGSG